MALAGRPLATRPWLLGWVRARVAHTTSAALSVPLPRPPTASGRFLRIVTVNDVYKLDNYAHLASAIAECKAAADDLGCEVIATLSGDFLSPCTLTSLDGGVTMVQALNVAGVDIVSLGNHEFDVGLTQLAEKLRAFRGVVLNSNVTSAELAHLPRYHTVRVGERRVVLAGLVTDDLSIFAPSGVPRCAPVADGARAAWALASRDAARPPDAFVPMTHQLIREDRALAAALATHRELAGRTPVILGGHEHELLVEPAANGSSLIVKMGADAERIGVVDVWWTAEGALRRAVSVRAASDWPAAPPARAFADAKHAFLASMMSAPIAQLRAATSSARVRHAPSALASFLLGLVKDALARERVELAFSQAGSFRGARDYVPGPFTIGDLFAEFAFPTELAVVSLPGWVIADSIAWSRARPTPAPEFLHADQGVEFAPDGRTVTRVNGAPLEPDRLYKAAVYQPILTGLNGIEPLCSYARAHVRVPSRDVCVPAKCLIIEHCMKRAWRELAGLDSLDSAAASNGGGAVQPCELAERIDGLFVSSGDRDRKDSIGCAELTAVFVKRRGHGPSAALIEQMIKTLDRNGDGRVDRCDLKAIAIA